MKSVVVDRQSATIRVVKDGNVTRELPFRVISDDTVIVGDKIFSGPLPDLSKWGEAEEAGKRRRRREESDGWDFRPTDHPTFFMPSPAPVVRWMALGPRQEFLQKVYVLQERLREVEDKKEEMLAAGLVFFEPDYVPGLESELKMLESEEKARKKFAARQSRQKRPYKTERVKAFRRKPKDDEQPEGESKHGKKKKGKGKKKSKGGDGGEQKGGKSKGNQGGKGKGQRRRGGK